MKKFLVIGNPITHSLSPKLHNYWFKQNNIDAVYEKRQIEEEDIKNVVSEIRNGILEGMNVTVPFKKSVIKFLDDLSPFASETQSVNTIYKEKNKIVGGNTDIGGFGASLNYINYNLKGKTVFILGAGGVVPSLIVALNHLGVSKIILSNRSNDKATYLKKKFRFINLVNWGQLKDFDMIINATSIGLNKNDKIPINFNNTKAGRLFYDIIYNPKKTNFLIEAQKKGNLIENGKMMFLYQAQLAFELWFNIKPEINEEVIKLVE